MTADSHEMNNLIGARDFSDGTTRPVYADKHGEYVIVDDGARVYGMWILPADEPMLWWQA